MIGVGRGGPIFAENRVIEGVVNAAREAVLTLPARGPSGQAQELDAVIDTGYDGFLTLSACLDSNLPPKSSQIGTPWHT